MTRIKGTVRSNPKAVGTAMEGVVDKALATVAVRIKRLSAQQVPHDKGPLQNSGVIQRISWQHFQISYNKEYARPQHEKRSYKHPKGRKSHYLKDPGDIVAKQVPQIVRSAGLTVGRVT